MLAGRPWRFAGVNMYWLGLDENVRDAQGPTYPTHQAIDAGFRSAAMLGSRLVRSISLGVSVGSPRSLEPSLGRFNDAAFDSIDYAVADARRFGQRLVIPLTDNWHFYTGGKHTFSNWFGYRDLPQQNAGNPRQRAIEDAFYTDQRVVAAFHAYIAHILNHVNPLTGLRLGDDPTIAIWEEGSELWDAPASWVEQTASFVKSLAPHALVATCDETPGRALSAPAGTDIIDQHMYPPSSTATTKNAAYARAHNVAYMVGEYSPFAANLENWLATVSATPQVSGDLAWSLLPYLPNGLPETHGDGYTFHYPGAAPREAATDALIVRHAAVMDLSS